MMALAGSAWLATAAPATKINIAHRGASAYAPEHTIASYRLALAMGADFVEQDLAVTRDGVLICLHDATLERTTDVERVFPDRATTVSVDGTMRRGWLANDFTLAEIKRLDAGSWFDAKFAGERVPTFDEVVAVVKGKAGLLPELKTPETYAGRAVHFEALVAAALDRHGLRGPAADAKTPVILQTFGETSARTLAEIEIGVPVVLLVSDARRLGSAEAVRAWQGIVSGLGPDKAIVARTPALVQWAHAAGLTVMPYTFRAKDGGDVTAEMRRFLYELNVDGLFTDNPDLFPRR
jgi:glycerophosphoryl diester phosphodiesterase